MFRLPSCAFDPVGTAERRLTYPSADPWLCSWSRTMSTARQQQHWALDPQQLSLVDRQSVSLGYILRWTIQYLESLDQESASG